jgi:hypothetical protein
MAISVQVDTIIVDSTPAAKAPSEFDVSALFSKRVLRWEPAASLISPALFSEV